MTAFRTKRFHLSDSDRHAVISRIDEILRQEPTMAFAYIHGSFARGEDFGDIDIAVYLNDQKDRADTLNREFTLENQLEKDFPYPVDVRILNGAPLSFCYQAIRGGIRVAIVDNNRRTDFEEWVWTSYHDFAPFRHDYLKGVLGLDPQ